MTRAAVLSPVAWLWAPLLVVLGLPAAAPAASGDAAALGEGIVAACPRGACLGLEDGEIGMMTGGASRAAVPGAAHAVTAWESWELPPAWVRRERRRAAELHVADASAEWMTDQDKRARLEERQRSLDRQLLDAQRARFVARARNESPEEIERLEKAFEDIKAERRENLDRLRSLGAFN